MEEGSFFTSSYPDKRNSFYLLSVGKGGLNREKKRGGAGPNHLVLHAPQSSSIKERGGVAIEGRVGRSIELAENPVVGGKGGIYAGNIYIGQKEWGVV